MKKLTILVLSLVLVSALAIFLGCSGSSTEPQLGDPADPQFQAVQTVIGEDAIEGVDKTMELSFEFIDSIPGSSFVSKDSEFRQALSGGDEVLVVDSFNYGYANGWHSFQFWAWVADTLNGDTVDIAGIDSLQVLNNGTPLQVPDSTVDELNIRTHFNVSVRNTNIAGSGDHSVNITGISPELLNPVVINGTANESASGTFTDSNVVCDFSFDNALTINDLTASVAGGTCPTSGTISLSSAVDLFCTETLQTGVDTVIVQGNWTVAATFNNTNVTVTYQNGDTFWQFSTTCDGPSASPAMRWMPGPSR